MDTQATTKDQAKAIMDAHEHKYRALVWADEATARAFPNAPYPTTARRFDAWFWEHVYTPQFERLLNGPDPCANRPGCPGCVDCVPEMSDPNDNTDQRSY
tara:strand:+ start:1363 stop:1662 length:300 start_codon:yes stop_codon:yes gene_type:complete